MPKHENTLTAVLITGSSSGIGEATAYAFASTGAALILTYHSSKTDGLKVQARCLELGAQHVLLAHLDLKDDKSIDHFASLVKQKYSRLDILINNAGFISIGPLSEQSFADIDNQILVNLSGLIKLTKHFAPLVTKCILNVGSNLGIRGHKNLATYSATKFAVRGFSQALSAEYPRLKVYALNPSLTATKMGNFQGLPAARVAQIIFNAASGHYRAGSGADINVRDYLYGQRLKWLIVLLRRLKSLFRKLFA